MSDNYAAIISIGGKLTASGAKQFLKALQGEVGSDRIDDTMTSKTMQFLSDMLDGDGSLELRDDEATNGYFEDIEKACRSLGLSYLRHSDASAEHDAFDEWYTPKLGVVTCQSDNNQNAVLRVEEVEDEINALVELVQTPVAKSILDVSPKIKFGDGSVHELMRQMAEKIESLKDVLPVYPTIPRFQF